MKSVLMSFVILLLILLAYWLDLFGLFAQKGAIWWALGLVLMVFLVGIKVLGNPWAGFVKEDRNEDK